MSKFREQPVLNSVLLLGAVALVVVASTAVGAASPSSLQSTRTATVKRGVVQSTVSGSGNVQSADQLDLGFKTSGTVAHIYVKEGQQVVPGQLLATLDPKSAEVTLQQARASLQSAQATLAQEEESEGETSTGQGSTGGTGATTAAQAATPKSSSSTPSSSSSSSSKAKQSAATREANLASARAAVKSDELVVEGDEQAVQSTKLYAPRSGTIVSLAGEVGETVSGTGTTRATPSTSTSGSTGSGASSGGSGKSSASGASSTASSGSTGSSSSSSFAVLSDLESLQLVVSLSESEIGSVHVGQVATVTIEALSGKKASAHVVKVGEMPSSSSGAVSYDVTFQLDQGVAGLKVGMSATAEVIVAQAEGIYVPTSAIKGGSVTVVRGGRQVSQTVTTGLAGDSATIVLSGLSVGERVVLPTSTTSTSGASLSSRLGSRLGRTGGLGGALGGGGLGGGALPAGGPPGGG